MSDGKVVIDSEFNGKEAEQGFSTFQSKMDGAAKTAGKTGKGLTKYATAPLMGVATAAVLTGAGFQKQMSKVQAISGATGGELEKLEGFAREMGSSTSFSASQSAQGLEYMALAGWKTKDMMDGLPGVMNLAASGAIDLGRASDIVTDTMSMYSMEASDAGKASDIFAYAQSNSNTSVDQLGEALAQGGAAAAAAGNDLEQTSAIMGLFADNGMKGSRAGTTVTSMLRDIKNGSEDGAIAIGDTSVAVYDQAGNMRSLTDIMEDVNGATDDMSGKQRDEALSSIFQTEAMAGVNLMMGEGTDRVRELEKGLYGSEGAAKTAAETMKDNLAGSFAALKSAGEGLLLDVFDVMEPILRKIVDGAKSLANWFGGLSDKAKLVGIAVAAFVAILGPLLMLLPVIVSSISLLVAGFAALISVPGLIVVGVLALIAGLIYLWNTSETFRSAVMAIFNAFKDSVISAFNTMLTSIKPIWESLLGLWEAAKPLLMALGAIVIGVVVVAFGIFISIISAVISAIGPIINAIVNLGSMFFNIFNAIISLLMLDFSGALEFWNLATENSVAFVVGLWTGLKNFISTFITTIIDFFKHLYNVLVGNSIIPDLVEAVVEWFNNMLGWIIGIVSSIVTSVINFFTNLYNNVKTIFTNVYNFIKQLLVYIKEFFSSSLAFIFNTVKTVFSNIYNAIKTRMSNMKTNILNMLNNIKTTFSNILSTIKTIIGNKFTQFITAVRGKMNSVKNAIKEIWGKVKSFFSGINLFSIGKNIIQGLWNGIKGMAGTLKRNVSNFVKDNIPGPIKSVLGINSPSKVMEEEVGEESGKGIELGLENRMRHVAQKAKDIAKQVAVSIPRPQPKPRPVGDDKDAPEGDQSMISRNESKPVEIILQVDKRTFAKLLVDDINRLQGGSVISRNLMKGAKG